MLCPPAVNDEPFNAPVTSAWNVASLIASSFVLTLFKSIRIGDLPAQKLNPPFSLTCVTIGSTYTSLCTISVAYGSPSLMYGLFHEYGHSTSSPFFLIVPCTGLSPVVQSQSLGTTFPASLKAPFAKYFLF